MLIKEAAEKCNQLSVQQRLAQRELTDLLAQKDVALSSLDPNYQIKRHKTADVLRTLGFEGTSASDDAATLAPSVPAEEMDRPTAAWDQLFD
jgi:hypothetical protein